MNGNGVDRAHHSVLIVEGDRRVAEELQLALADTVYGPCAIATTGAEAVVHASTERLDAVVLAIGLTGSPDGLETGEVLHRRFDLPVIYVVGDREVGLIERARTSEPYGYLARPVRAVELLSVLDLTLYKHRNTQRAQLARSLEGTGPSDRPTRRTTVLLAEDHVIVREGLVSLLADHDFDVVGAVGDGHQLIEAALKLRPDVILTDLSMPGPSGLDVLSRLKAERVSSKIIILTMHNDAELAARATRIGASGFLLKHSAGEELVIAIQQALQGRVYLTPAVTKGVMERLASPSGLAGPILTSRQLDVLRLIVDGHRMKEIAAALDLSTRTVETHKYELMRVLDVHSTAELVRYALTHRLVVE